MANTNWQPVSYRLPRHIVRALKTLAIKRSTPERLMSENSVVVTLLSHAVAAEGQPICHQCDPDDRACLGPGVCKVAPALRDGNLPV